MIATLLATTVVISTSMGDIKVKLEDKKAPATVANFLKYVKDKQYDGTVFHRVIKGFMIQGGGFDESLHEKPTKYPPVKNESQSSKLKNVAGEIAMARTADPDSATCQFYINTVNNPALDQPPGYTAFGKVVKGMDVVHKIEAVKTTTKPSGDGAVLADVPVQPVVIKSIKIAGK